MCGYSHLVAYLFIDYFRLQFITFWSTMRRRVKWTEKKNEQAIDCGFFRPLKMSRIISCEPRMKTWTKKIMNLVDDDERQPHGQTGERQRTDGNKYLPRNYSTHRLNGDALRWIRQSGVFITHTRREVCIFAWCGYHVPIVMHLWPEAKIKWLFGLLACVVLPRCHDAMQSMINSFVVCVCRWRQWYHSHVIVRADEHKIFPNYAFASLVTSYNG